MVHDKIADEVLTTTKKRAQFIFGFLFGGLVIALTGTILIITHPEMLSTIANNDLIKKNLELQNKIDNYKNYLEYIKSQNAQCENRVNEISLAYNNLYKLSGYGNNESENIDVDKGRLTIIDEDENIGIVVDKVRDPYVNIRIWKDMKYENPIEMKKIDSVYSYETELKNCSLQFIEIPYQAEFSSFVKLYKVCRTKK